MVFRLLLHMSICFSSVQNSYLSHFYTAYVTPQLYTVDLNMPPTHPITMFDPTNLLVVGVSVPLRECCCCCFLCGNMQAHHLSRWVFIRAHTSAKAEQALKKLNFFYYCNILTNRERNNYNTIIYIYILYLSDLSP